MNFINRNKTKKKLVSNENDKKSQKYQTEIQNTEKDFISQWGI